MVKNQTPAVGGRTQGGRIADICERWQDEMRDWDEDCAIVSRYYSGAIMESPEDQDTLGLVDHANFLVGRAGMMRAREEALAAVIKPEALISLKLRDFDGTPAEKAYQERQTTRILDDFLRKEDASFLYEIEETLDRQVAHGDALMMFPPEGEGWRPFAAKILTDMDAPQNAADDNFARWAVYSDIQLGEALAGIAAGAEGWESSAEKFLRSLWRRRYDIVDKKDVIESAVTTFDDALTMIESVSPEEWSHHGDVGHNLHEFCNSRFRAFYYYQKDFSAPENGIPVDMYIIARVEHRFKEADDFFDGDPLLYARKGAYSSVGHAMTTFVLDSNIGVMSPSWGTIKGLGHVNYNADRWTNLLLSSMVNSAVDRNTPLLEVQDSATVKELEKFVKRGYQANAIIPAGASFVDKSKQGMQVGEALNMVQMLQQQANSNAIGYTGVSDAPAGELRVSALARQQQDARTASNRGELFAMRIRALCKEVARRLLKELRQTSFYGVDAKALGAVRKELKRAGVKLMWLDPDNVVADYARLVGDGDPQQRLNAAQAIVNNIGFLPSESRHEALMEWYAATTGDWERARQVFDVAQPGNPDQQALAMSKAGDMLMLGVPYPITKRDEPEAQLPTFLQIGESLVQSAVTAGQFASEKDYEGLLAIGQHSVLLIQLLEQRGQRDLAKVYQEALQNLSTAAQEPLNNMRQAAEAQQDPRLEMERAKLQLAAAREDREERTFGHKQQKDTAQVQGKRQAQDFNQVIQTRRLMNEDAHVELDKQKARLKELETSLKLRNG